MSRAKGSNMHHMRTWVQRRHGDPAWDAVVGAMDDADQTELRALLPVGWYDLALQHRLLHRIDQSLGRGDGALAEDIGVYEAEQDLTVVHRLFLRLANPAYVLEKAGDYWGRFYESGRWTVRREASNRALATLSDVDPWDELFGRYLTAYIRRMFELVGAKDVRVASDLRASGMELDGSWR